MSLLEVNDLATDIIVPQATVHAVRRVSFRLEAGETLGIVGESGSGKTMTANSLIRLLPSGGEIISGEVLLDGRDLLGVSRRDLRQVRGNDIAMVFQDPMTALDPTMPIGAQIAETVRTHQRATRKQATDRAAEVLALVGMPHARERLGDYPHQLSGGLRQRVMIAMALSCEPSVLIADEPTTALDVTIQAQILDLLDELRHQLGMAIILITHDLGVIAERADRTLVMYAGAVVERSATSRLFRDMHHPYTEALLASIPQVDQDPEAMLYAIPGLPPALTGELVGCQFAPRCRYATEQCMVQAPLLGGPEPDHEFACYHPIDRSAGDVRTARFSVDAPEKIAVRAGRSDPAPDGATPILLHLSSVTKEYPTASRAAGLGRRQTVKAVTDVSLEVRAGETFGLVGESGCGKTTVGRLMVALEEPDAGEVLFEGQDLASIARGALKRLRRDLHLMFQDPYASLDPRMRVSSIVKEPLVIQGRGSKIDQVRRTYELLGEVGLSADAADRYPHEFSGGQRQRIGLARALALNPRFVVADEPVSALDVSIRSQILNLMKRLQQDHDLTYVIISHDLSVVRYMADRVGVMYLGRLVEVGTVRDIYESAAHPYTAGLLASIPIPDPDARRPAEQSQVRGELPSALNPPSGCRFRTRCPRAQTRCAEEVPGLTRFGTEHLAACHFPLQRVP